MSKCREAFEQWCAEGDHEPTMQRWHGWQSAWNARGKVDAEICKTIAHSEAAQRSGVISAFDCAEAIKKENEQ